MTFPLWSLHGWGTWLHLAQDNLILTAPNGARTTKAPKHQRLSVPPHLATAAIQAHLTTCLN